MTVAVFTEAVHPCACIVSEAPVFASREAAIIPQNQTIVVGQVMGKSVNTALASVSGTSLVLEGASTANGTITMDATAPVGASAQDGVYVIEFNSATEYGVNDPKGVVIGEAIVGATFNNQIKFVIAAGGNAFTVGDRFLVTIAVPLTAITWAPYNPANTDGTGVARGVALFPVVTGAGVTAKIAVFARNGEVRGSDLTWFGGASGAQIAEGTAQLAALGIMVR